MKTSFKYNLSKRLQNRLQKMDFKQYKALDIFVFTLIASLLEAVTVYLFHIFNSQIYTLSFSFVLGFICVYRWNYFGLITACVSSLVGVLTRQFIGQEVTYQLFLAYSIPYLAIGCEMFFFKLKKNDKNQIRDNIGYLSLMYFVSYFLVEILKAICQIGNGEFYKIAIQYFSYDLLNIVFNYIVLLIARKQRNLLVDMKQYVIDVNKPMAEIKEIRSTSDYLKLESMCQNDEINEQALLDGGTLTTEDLKELEKTRRQLEGKETFYDKENSAINNYEKSKKKKGDKK